METICTQIKKAAKDPDQAPLEGEEAQTEATSAPKKQRRKRASNKDADEENAKKTKKKTETKTVPPNPSAANGKPEEHLAASGTSGDEPLGSAEHPPASGTGDKPVGSASDPGPAAPAGEVLDGEPKKRRRPQQTEDVLQAAWKLKETRT